MEYKGLLQLPFEWVEYSCRKSLWMAIIELAIVQVRKWKLSLDSSTPTLRVCSSKEIQGMI